MIYEWYSGSDKSLTVPQRLSELDHSDPEPTADERMTVLRELLRIEQDKNWRGYLYGRLGAILDGGGREAEAVEAYTEAFREFDPLARNFRDVVGWYCQALYGMAQAHARTGEFEEVAEFTSAIIANIDEIGWHPFYEAMAHAYQGLAFNMLGNKTSLSFFYSLALGSYLRAHHLAPEDPDFLKGLVHGYFNLGDKEHFILSYEMFEKVAEPGEVRDEVVKFVRERASEIGVKVSKNGRLQL